VTDLRALIDCKTVGARLRGWVEGLSVVVMRSHAELRPTITCRGNDVAFGVTLSFDPVAHPAENEVAVVSLVVQIRGATLELRSDVTRGGAEVVADGPSADVALVKAGDEGDGTLAAWMRDIECFVGDEVPGILEPILNEPRS
jgi:hypothetical protein